METLRYPESVIGAGSEGAAEASLDWALWTLSLALLSLACLQKKDKDI